MPANCFVIFLIQRMFEHKLKLKTDKIMFYLLHFQCAGTGLNEFDIRRQTVNDVHFKVGHFAQVISRQFKFDTAPLEFPAGLVDDLGRKNVVVGNIDDVVVVVEQMHVG